MYWVYMNRSRCHEDIHRPLGVGFDKTSSKFPLESVSSGVTVGVQYLGEVVVSWTDVVGVKGWCQGVRDAKESVCFLRGFGLRDGLNVPVAGVVVVAFNGGVAYKACHRRTMSPCPVMGEIPVCPGCISSAIHHFYYGLKAVQRTTVRP